MEITIPKYGGAYARLTKEQQSFVDGWISTSSIAQALRCAGLKPESFATAYHWFNNVPDVNQAIKDRCEILQLLSNNTIAPHAEVLQHLTFLMRESKDEKIQLKAAQSLDRHWSPKFDKAININLKDLIDRSEQACEQEVKVHR